MKSFFKNILLYCNNFSGAIIAILTIVLIITTIIYAGFTFSMSNTMKKDLDLRSKPYLSIEKIKGFNVNETDIQITYLIQNVGEVPIQYEITASTFNNQNNAPQQDSPVILYPKQTIEIDTKLITYQSISDEILGETILELTYSALDNKKDFYFHRRGFSLTSIGRFYIIEDDAGDIIISDVYL